MADSQGLQLLQKKRSLDKSDEGGMFFVVSAIILVVTTISYGGLWWWSDSIASKIANIDTELNSIESARDKSKEKRLLATYSQLEQADSVLRSHVYMSRAMLRVQALIQARVQVISLSVDVAKKSISIKGVADNYTTVSKQISSLYLEPSFENVTLQKASSQPNGRVDFDLIIEFSPNKLLLESSQAVPAK